MQTLQNVFMFTHFLGMAALVGGFFVALKDGRTNAPMVWGARAQLLTGLLMVGVVESQKWEINHAWVGTKLVIAFIVVGLIEAAASKEKKGADASSLVKIAGVLAIINVAVAALWH